MTEQKLDPNIRLLRQVAVASVLWAATFVVTKNDTFGHPGTLAMRVALVLIGIGGFIPVVLVYAKSIRMQHEFNQRIHYIALAIALAVTAVVSSSSDLLFQAGFVRHFPSTGLWALMVAIWFVAMILTPRLYR